MSMVVVVGGGAIAGLGVPLGCGRRGGLGAASWVGLQGVPGLGVRLSFMGGRNRLVLGAGRGFYRAQGH